MMLSPPRGQLRLVVLAAARQQGERFTESAVWNAAGRPRGFAAVWRALERERVIVRCEDGSNPDWFFADRDAEGESMPTEYLTTGEFAAILGCSKNHVVRLADGGAVRCHRIGRHRRFHAQIALNYAASQGVPWEAEPKFRGMRPMELNDVVSVG